MRLAITREGELFLDQQPLPFSALKETLATRLDAEPLMNVHIYADRGAPVDPVVQVLDISRQAGILGVTLATEESLAVSPAIEPPEPLDAGSSDDVP